MAYTNVQEDEVLTQLLQDLQAPGMTAHAFPLLLDEPTHPLLSTEVSLTDQHNSPGPTSLCQPKRDKRFAKAVQRKRQRLPRVAFVVKSEEEDLCDGYKWRKYGQKPVKNSPYPRRYYQCKNVRCKVKKRIERDSSDPTTLVITYEGQHDHYDHYLLNGVDAAWFVDVASPINKTISKLLYFPPRGA